MAEIKKIFYKFLELVNRVILDTLALRQSACFHSGNLPLTVGCSISKLTMLILKLKLVAKIFEKYIYYYASVLNFRSIFIVNFEIEIKVKKETRMIVL